jgi:hypothetical protein
MCIGGYCLALAHICMLAQAMQYMGTGSPADEDLLYSLQTSAASGTAAPYYGLPPCLPSGTLLGGVAAAMLNHCELAGLPATGLVSVQMGPSPSASQVMQLGRAVYAALHSATGVLLPLPKSQEGTRELLARINAATDEVYASSAGNSIFI